MNMDITSSSFQDKMSTGACEVNCCELRLTGVGKVVKTDSTQCLS